jgi:hypothetical protein
MPSVTFFTEVCEQLDLGGVTGLQEKACALRLENATSHSLAGRTLTFKIKISALNIVAAPAIFYWSAAVLVYKKSSQKLFLYAFYGFAPSKLGFKQSKRLFQSNFKMPIGLQVNRMPREQLLNT